MRRITKTLTYITIGLLIVSLGVSLLTAHFALAIIWTIAVVLQWKYIRLESNTK